MWIHPDQQTKKVSIKCRLLMTYEPTILLPPLMKIVTAREFWHSSITNILSFVVPNESSRTIPALPSFSAFNSSNLGTILPPVAMAINWNEKCKIIQAPAKKVLQKTILGLIYKLFYVTVNKISVIHVYMWWLIDVQVVLRRLTYHWHLVGFV